MKNNILKSSNLFHLPKVYRMPLVVSGTGLDIRERQLNRMLFLPSGHSWICWLFDVLFFCSEKYVKSISKIGTKVQLKKKKKNLKIEGFLFVCFHFFSYYLGIWEWNMNIQSQNDWWGYQPPWLSTKGFLGYKIFSVKTGKVLGKP